MRQIDSKEVNQFDRSQLGCQSGSSQLRFSIRSKVYGQEVNQEVIYSQGVNHVDISELGGHLGSSSQQRVNQVDRSELGGQSSRQFVTRRSIRQQFIAGGSIRIQFISRGSIKQIDPNLRVNQQIVCNQEVNQVAVNSQGVNQVDS